jgi:acyl-CoA thioester hydrolase
MPLTHVRTFRVRHYECDANGHLGHANYLRYMQEAAFDASRAAGYDLARYSALGYHWLVRETKIEYLRPPRYGESVQVETWVADFRRIRSLRAYELRIANSGELAARAHTDWVFLDSATGRPAPIPSEMKLAFVPEGISQSTAPRPRFPSAPPRTQAEYRTRRRVEWRDLDQAGHVNNAVYLAYIEDCGMQMAASCGWPATRMVAEGFGLTTRQHLIEYLLPGLLDDELEVSTWLSEVNGEEATAVRHSTVERSGDGALLVRSRTVHVWVDLANGEPAPLPIGFLTDLSSNTADRSLS